MVILWKQGEFKTKLDVNAEGVVSESCGDAKGSNEMMRGNLLVGRGLGALLLLSGLVG
jgi:hypothetical protein